MAKKISTIIDALTALGDAIKASDSSGSTMRAQFGWNFPNLTAPQVSLSVYKLRDRLSKIDAEQISDKWDPAPLAAKITEEIANINSYFWSGNGHEAYRGLAALLDHIEAIFVEFFIQKVDWQVLADGNQMPEALAKKTRSLAARIKTVSSNIEGLDSKVATILAAHDAALALPTDLETLEETQSRVDTISKAVDKDAASVAGHSEDVKSLIDEIKSSRDEAKKLVIRTEDAYSAATTIGLGASFESRASSLAKSMWVWVAGLLVALTAGSVIGWHRISFIEELLSRNASSTSIWLNTLLSALSIAAPVWFAWIATKQIGQRFRLAEDYAFKASVAKAYEGYRREAARLDPAFAHQLFKSALERLDEAPLRFVEHETFGSPWHEAMGLRRRKEAGTTENGPAANGESASRRSAASETTTEIAEDPSDDDDER